MITLEILAKELNNIYPTAFYSWQMSGKPVPDFPYIIYLIDKNNSFGADNKAYSKSSDCLVELYTEYKQIYSEEKIENLFDKLEVFYQKSENYIPDEKMYQVCYEINF